MPDTIPRADVLELARDNFLARFVAGGRSAAEVAAIVQTERMEDTEANRIRGVLGGGESSGGGGALMIGYVGDDEAYRRRTVVKPRGVRMAVVTGMPLSAG